jgi:hypothetical protein
MTYLCSDHVLEIGGCIYREGKTSTASRVQLGAVAAIASNKLPPQLRMDGLDKIILFPNEHGDYECELFWDGVIPSPAFSGSQAHVFTLIIISIYIDVGCCYLQHLRSAEIPRSIHCKGR